LGALLHRVTQLNGSPTDILDGLRKEVAQTASRVVAQEGRRLDEQRTDAASLWTSLVQEAVVVAEDAGALRLANVILHLAYLALKDQEPAVQHGRLIAQRARVARKANDVDQSRVLYQEALVLGEAIASDELIARAHIGFSLLARARGNLPAAISHIDCASDAAARCGVREVTANVHHERMIHAAMQSRFDDAVVHAWSAFRDAEGDAMREADALTNTGQILLDIGRVRVALRVFLAALSRRPPNRTALPLLGGAARAASLLGDEQLVRRFIANIDAMAIGPYHRHDAILAIGESAVALHPFAPAEAETRRAAAYEEAVRLQFHEYAFRFASFTSAAPLLQPEHAPSEDFLRAVGEAGSLEVAAEYAGA
jgi:tetratricopeptide (TPR) repeat protein